MCFFLVFAKNIFCMYMETITGILSHITFLLIPLIKWLQFWSIYLVIRKWLEQVSLKHCKFFKTTLFRIDNSIKRLIVNNKIHFFIYIIIASNKWLIYETSSYYVTNMSSLNSRPVLSTFSLVYIFIAS